VDLSFGMWDENDIAVVAEFVAFHGLKRLGVQVDDNLLHCAPSLCSELHSRIGITCFILGDTPYAPCCVDEVGAQHFAADAVLLFGFPCYSGTAGIPVCRLTPKSTVRESWWDDSVHACRDVAPSQTRQFVLLCDVQYEHLAVEFAEHLFRAEKVACCVALADPPSIQGHRISRDRARFAHCAVADGVVGKAAAIALLHKEDGDQSLPPPAVRLCGRAVYKLSPGSSGLVLDSAELEESGDCVILFVGCSSSALGRRLGMRFGSSCTVLHADPQGKPTWHSLDVTAALMQRFNAIDRIQNAQTVGVVYGTVAVHGFQEVHDRCTRLIRSTGRKVYSMVVGKLNQPKLSNFSHVEVFVVLSCPQSFLTLDMKAYPVPLVCPYDVEVAFGAREWDMRYILDFDELLESSSGTASQEHLQSGAGNMALVSRNFLDELVPLSSRGFQGLSLEDTKPPSLAVHGQHGIAAEYVQLDS